MQLLNPLPIRATFLAMAQQESKAARGEGVIVIMKLRLAHGKIEAQGRRKLPVRMGNPAFEDMLFCNNAIGDAHDLGEAILDDFDGLRRTAAC